MTAEGRVLHDGVDAGHPESRNGVRVLRAVHVASDAHSLHGVADVVEMHEASSYPIEYKRGLPKTHRADEVQLCAQTICLEEMTGCAVPEGALFYGKYRRRKTVAIDHELRALTLTVAAEVHVALDAAMLPPSVHEPRKCNAC